MRELLHIPSGKIIKFCKEDEEGGTVEDIPSLSVQEFVEFRQKHNLVYCTGLKLHTEQEVLENCKKLGHQLLPEGFKAPEERSPEQSTIIET